MSPVMCHLSPVTCRMLPVTCHLSHVKSTAKAMDPAPTNSPTMLHFASQKTDFFFKAHKIIKTPWKKLVLLKPNIHYTPFHHRSLVHREVPFPRWDGHTHSKRRSLQLIDLIRLGANSVPRADNSFDLGTAELAGLGPSAATKA